MRHFIILTFISVLFSNCSNSKLDKKSNSDTKYKYPTISYLDIKLDSNGHLPSNPYILEFTNGKKSVVFCGVNHLTDNTDTANPMFTKIEEIFFAFKPDIAINEGGDVSNKVYSSKTDALFKDGEIGLTKILSDSLSIKTVDGDPTTEFEFKELLKTYSKGEFLAYIVTERLMWGLKGQRITDTIEIRKNYDEFIQNYILEEGKIHLSDTERTFGFYKSNYQQLLKRPFDIADLEPTNPFDPSGKFQKIGRTSKEIRDQFLLNTVDKLLDTYDRIIIVFGGWHLLTCQPGLEELIQRNRK
ncbi:MAG: hypothetical protein KGZ74_19455 [Chitinophagaceae bacterium]|nr:hypothetical protein [Chitinophagaceae bacterium]